ncbi:MAG: SPOR domain-containing protein [Methylovulum sp.]|uniref:SPOR domain-containing protein n=1 Tax=Methylovulum sp. TaxID=1916980 RepID=UPI0026184D45|nr:SPOR domain-containing protein [Methylovulum sp.]MDD2724910.1 SPOR domain-containing protein [Methylovulum sp.]MDD5124280.1 SPOR domain-containing protein [Methylovulum sp.]
MARDYKHRVSNKKKSAPKHVVGTWQWLLIAALVLGFVVFLVYLRITAPEEKAVSAPAEATTKNDKVSAPTNAKKADADKKTDPGKPKLPHFEFYSVLPDKEKIIPDYEIKTREREERIGKAKEAKYIMQVGSFKTFKEADQLRAKLALMGIASKVDKAKIDGVPLHRVKLGPFTQMKSVNDIRLRLKSMGANVIVTEIAATKPVVVQPIKPHRQRDSKPGQ